MLYDGVIGKSSLGYGRLEVVQEGSYTYSKSEWA